ncbi:MAG: CYTH domain-containing protein [Planctomycetota bacterium]|jgi:uncharacterized protein YjbK
MDETELKFILMDREDYERILKILAPPRAVKDQTNHYYLGDPAGILDRGEAMLRLRTVSHGPAVLAFKDRLVKDGALFKCREIEAPLQDETAARLLAGEIDPLTLDSPPAAEARAVLGEGTIRIGGVSRTRRSEFVLDSDEVLQVDMSTFPGGREDWEIELETHDPVSAQRRLRGLLGRSSIVLRPQTRTKVRRFLDALGR